MSDVTRVHADLVRLVAAWTASNLQAEVAASVGVDLDPTEVRVVYLLGLSGGALGMSALVERTQLSRPTLSKLGSRLVADRVAERHRAGRQVEIRLTGRGWQAYDLLVEAGHRMVREATEGWEEAELAGFRAHLDRFVSRLSGWNE
jgi:DNA-binding MarR family transcriptional regulator